MGNVLQMFQIAVAVCRIQVYSCWQWLLCRTPQTRKHELHIICVGLCGAGKSTLLGIVNDESVEDIQPTKGFNIKAVEADNIIFTVKELGGSDDIMQYWSRYYAGALGLIYVLDSTADQKQLDLIRENLHCVLSEKKLTGCPSLILASHQDKAGAWSSQQLQDVLKLSEMLAGRLWIFRTCSKTDQKSIRAAFQDFERLFCTSKPEAPEPSAL